MIDDTTAVTDEPELLEREEYENLGISLPGITGMNSGNTMRVEMVIEGISVTALIDSGSTHNFIDTEIAESLGLKVQECPSLQVAVANGALITIQAFVNMFYFVMMVTDLLLLCMLSICPGSN